MIWNERLIFMNFGKKKSKIDVESLHFIDENDRGFFDRVQIVVFHGLEIKKKIADAHNFFTH